MGKKRKASEEDAAAVALGAKASTESTFDPSLASLFAASSGPVKFPKVVAQKSKEPPSDLPTPEPSASEPSEQELEDDSDAGSEASEDAKQEASNERPGKRRKLDDEEIEDVYFRKLAKEEAKDLQQIEDEEDRRSESPSNDLEDLSEDELEDDVPVHESLTNAADDDAADKVTRTVFLSNVSTSAIKSKTSKKELLTYLESALPPSTKIESIRFRSTAYSKDAGPKKAAYATKALMDETASSTHAYVVLSTPAAAAAMTKLNGTLILDRHLHIDNLGSPMPTVHRRCIFVGNLPFVDEETLPTLDEDNPRSRPKAKQRSDPEEGLWRTFAKAGTVENVRMVRDKATRIGKGFAYVQFTDENAVERALLMNDKKYPPLLPRKLRVMRARKPATKPNQGNNFQQRRNDSRGQAPRGNREEARRGKQDANEKKRPQRLGKDVVFEGYRASSDKPMKMKQKGRSGGKDGKKKAKPTTRSAKRGTAFRQGGGKKRRDADS